MEMGMATTAADQPSLAKYSNGEMGNGRVTTRVFWKKGRVGEK